ncbi:histidine phosphatase family protein [Sphingomonas sp.]|uniref:SixA phosphatase family protein n=1 Tax=Sphingomonas sp. TaxID=28214 RepID=UPI001D1D177D|nr:histidine phosphatase family protein [Sphingomonas sp.]MBX9795419.1 histidine phosphatase family protein [Sphingomonas sp.]
MKHLFLLRHAKSGWDDPQARDFDRRLNARGTRGAVTMGRYLKAERLRFDHVLASDAARVTETITGVEQGYGAPLHAVWERRIYLASASALIDLVNALPDSAGSALMVGHNPGLEDLVLQLVPDDAADAARAAVYDKFPTAALAEITFDIDRWDQVARGTGRLARFIRPRDLDPALGPDAD